MTRIHLSVNIIIKNIGFAINHASLCVVLFLFLLFLSSWCDQTSWCASTFIDRCLLNEIKSLGNARDKFSLGLKCLVWKPTDPLLPKPIIIPRLFKMSVIKELKKKRLLRAASLPAVAFSKMSFQHHKCHRRLKDQHCLKPAAVHGETEEGRADEALHDDDDDDDDELHGVPVKTYGVVVMVTFKGHLGSWCETQARAWMKTRSD